MIRILFVLLLLMGCDSSPEKPVFYRIETSDLVNNGFILNEKKIVKSKQMSVYLISDILSHQNYTVYIDEFETTEDAINFINIEIEQRNSDFALEGSIVYNDDNERFTVDVIKENSEIDKSHCMTKRIVSSDSGELRTADHSCLFQKRRFIFGVESNQEIETNMTEVDRIAKLFIMKIK